MTAYAYGVTGAEMALVRTAVKTSAYTASPGDLVPCDVSAGAFTVTLPAAPADGTRVAVKVIAASAASQYLLTVATQGGDVLNKAGGPASASLSLVNQGAVLAYQAPAAIWTVTSGDLPLAGVKQLIPDWFNIALYGAVAGPGDSSAAIQAAVTAACAVGGTVYVPASAAGFTCNSTITPTAGKPFNLVGDGSAGSKITFSTSGPAISFAGNTGSQRVGFQGISLVQDGSGDVLAIGSSSGSRLPQLQCYDAGFTTGTSNTGGSCINSQGPASSSSFADSSFVRCFFATRSATRTVPALNLTSQVAGGLSNVTWEKCDFNPSDNQQFCVYMSATTGGSDSGFHAAMSLRDCRFEHPWGGMVKSMSGRNLVLDNCIAWDLSVGSPGMGNSLIYIGSNANQVVSEGTRIVGCSRDLSGPDGTSTWDVEVESTCAQTLVDSFTTIPGFHTTALPALFNFHGCASATIINPQSAGAADGTAYSITNPPAQLTQPDLAPVASGWLPGDLGYAAAAFDPVMQSGAGTSRLITAGALNLIGLQLRGYATVSKADLYVIGAGSGLASGQCLIGLYSPAGVLIGSSADQSTAWASAGFKNATALTATTAGSLAGLAPGLYWLALLAAGTTMPSFSAAPGAQNISNFILNGRTTAATARYATNGSGLAALPSSITPGSSSLQQLAAWWAGLY